MAFASIHNASISTDIHLNSHKCSDISTLIVFCKKSVLDNARPLKKDSDNTVYYIH